MSTELRCSLPMDVVPSFEVEITIIGYQGVQPKAMIIIERAAVTCFVTAVQDGRRQGSLDTPNRKPVLLPLRTRHEDQSARKETV